MDRYPDTRPCLRLWLLPALLFSTALAACALPADEVDPVDALDPGASEAVQQLPEALEHLALGVRPGLTNPWASQTPYPAEIVEIELDAQQRALLHELNWRTGKRFEERELARLVYLHRMLPGNSTLMSFDPELREQQEREHAATRELAYVLDSGEANAEQIAAYYEFKQQHYRDRLEIIDFVIREPFWDAETHARYRRSRETAALELAKIDTQYAIARNQHARRRGAN